MGQKRLFSYFECLQSCTENSLRLRNRPGERRVLLEGKILEIWLDRGFTKK
jgi:hypothetical protein